MGRSSTHASDGTPRCSEPRQDAAGNWYCPACGRASGFASKMAVLGHLRSCRPGRPALKELLGAPAPAPAPAPAVYVPTPSEVANVNGLGAILTRLDQMASVQAQHSRALGNHITHLSAASAAPASSGGFSGTMPWLVAGAVGLGLVVAASRGATPQPPQPVRNPFKEARARKDHRAMCNALEARRLAGEAVEVPESCGELDDAPAPVAAAPAPAPRAAPAASIGDLLGTATKALGLMKGLKALKV